MIERISFYSSADARKRSGSFFDEVWPLLQEQSIKAKFKKVVKSVLRPSNPFAYLKENSLSLWEARNLFDDEMSRQCFDSTIILRSVGFNKYYYPFLHPLDFFECLESRPFISKKGGLPADYLGMPLYNFSIDLCKHGHVEIIAPYAYSRYQRAYGQYFPKINVEWFLPPKGGVVYDCGSCIGEVSAVFAGMVGATGQVHCFDPIPLHIQFCKYQQELNPRLGKAFYFCEAGVDSQSRQALHQDHDCHPDSKISPGATASGQSMISLDDYTMLNSVGHVHYVKMDIEGYEAAALEGGKNILREFKPMLAVSAYHKADDLWALPLLIKSLNPEYNLYFRHHSPCQWESVIYAS